MITCGKFSNPCTRDDIAILGHGMRQRSSNEVSIIPAILFIAFAIIAAACALFLAWHGALEAAALEQVSHIPGY